MIYNIIVAPIEAVVGWIFLFIINKIPSLGVIGAICGVSIAINILALPLYNIAESIQEKEREINKKLEMRVKRIKKGFKGDEEFMMLSEYYRQNGYHPLYALRGSLSILIEIPFFIAAYNYLSSSEILKESLFWIFSNLGEADRMFELSLGSLVLPVNILPIIMTAINFVSGYIYTKGATKRDKIQLYAMGIFFLVLLYNSPSGLVIYWILNNIFSLVKTVVLKTKHPGRFLHAFISIALLVFAYKFRNASKQSRFYFVLSVALLFTLAPLFIRLYKKLPVSHSVKVFIDKQRSNKSYFPLVLFSGLSLLFLLGFLLPSSTIATSPEEFSYLGSISNPSSFVWSTLWFYTGLFVFWPLVVYRMFSDTVRKGEAVLLFALLFVAVLDAFVFKGDYGKLSAQFFFEDANTLDSDLSRIYLTGPFIAFFAASAVFLFFDYFGRAGILSLLCLSVAIGEVGISIAKLNTIDKAYDAYTEYRNNNSDLIKDSGEIESVYHLSREGNNVVVLFLDRAFSRFLPYALEKDPNLLEQLRGFVFYPNTVSFGGNTTFASPAMMGGYEYTPEKISAREGTLRELHNEASLVAPLLFKNAGYSVVVTDAPYPNYSAKGDDFSAFTSAGIEAEGLIKKYVDNFYQDTGIESLGEDPSLVTEAEARNFSLLQVLPPFLRYTFEVSCRKINNQDYRDFIYSFSALYFLDDFTDFTGEGNTYTFIGSDTPHKPVELSSDLLHAAGDDDYFESNYMDNSELTYKHYTSFTASMEMVGKWLDYLRENECYDNTRIIIVSDHGFVLNNDIVTVDQAKFLPLLLVKDFNSNDDLKYDYTFMTNADTIFFALESLDDVSRVNPYTGNELTQEKENGISAYSSVDATEWNAAKIAERTSFILDKTQAWHIEDNIFDESNWVRLSQWEEKDK